MNSQTASQSRRFATPPVAASLQPPAGVSAPGNAAPYYDNSTANRSHASASDVLPPSPPRSPRTRNVTRVRKTVVVRPRRTGSSASSATTPAAAAANVAQEEAASTTTANAITTFRKGHSSGGASARAGTAAAAALGAASDDDNVASYIESPMIANHAAGVAATRAADAAREAVHMVPVVTARSLSRASSPSTGTPRGGGSLSIAAKDAVAQQQRSDRRQEGQEGRPRLQQQQQKQQQKTTEGLTTRGAADSSSGAAAAVVRGGLKPSYFPISSARSYSQLSSAAGFPSRDDGGSNGDLVALASGEGGERAQAAYGQARQESTESPGPVRLEAPDVDVASRSYESPREVPPLRQPRTYHHPHSERPASSLARLEYRGGASRSYASPTSSSTTPIPPPPPPPPKSTEAALVRYEGDLPPPVNGKDDGGRETRRDRGTRSSNPSSRSLQSRSVRAGSSSVVGSAGVGSTQPGSVRGDAASKAVAPSQPQARSRAQVGPTVYANDDADSTGTGTGESRHVSPDRPRYLPPGYDAGRGGASRSEVSAPLPVPAMASPASYHQRREGVPQPRTVSPAPESLHPRRVGHGASGGGSPSSSESIDTDDVPPRLHYRTAGQRTPGRASSPRGAVTDRGGSSSGRGKPDSDGMTAAGGNPLTSTNAGPPRAAAGATATTTTTASRSAGARAASTGGPPRESILPPAVAPHTAGAAAAAAAVQGPSIASTAPFMSDDDNGTDSRRGADRSTAGAVGDTRRVPVVSAAAVAAASGGMLPLFDDRKAAKPSLLVGTAAGKQQQPSPQQRPLGRVVTVISPEKSTAGLPPSSVGNGSPTRKDGTKQKPTPDKASKFFTPGPAHTVQRAPFPTLRDLEWISVSVVGAELCCSRPDENGTSTSSCTCCGVGLFGCCGTCGSNCCCTACMIDPPPPAQLVVVPPPTGEVVGVAANTTNAAFGVAAAPQPHRRNPSPKTMIPLESAAVDTGKTRTARECSVWREGPSVLLSSESLERERRRGAAKHKTLSQIFPELVAPSSDAAFGSSRGGSRGRPGDPGSAAGDFFFPPARRGVDSLGLFRPNCLLNVRVLAGLCLLLALAALVIGVVTDRFVEMSFVVNKSPTTLTPATTAPSSSRSQLEVAVSGLPDRTQWSAHLGLFSLCLNDGVCRSNMYIGKELLAWWWAAGAGTCASRPVDFSSSLTAAPVGVTVTAPAGTASNVTASATATSAAPMISQPLYKWGKDRNDASARLADDATAEPTLGKGSLSAGAMAIDICALVGVAALLVSFVVLVVSKVAEARLTNNATSSVELDGRILAAIRTQHVERMIARAGKGTTGHGAGVGTLSSLLKKPGTAQGNADGTHKGPSALEIVRAASGQPGVTGHRGSTSTATSSAATDVGAGGHGVGARRWITAETAATLGDEFYWIGLSEEDVIALSIDVEDADVGGSATDGTDADDDDTDTIGAPGAGALTTTIGADGVVRLAVVGGGGNSLPSTPVRREARCPPGVASPLAEIARRSALATRATTHRQRERAARLMHEQYVHMHYLARRSLLWQRRRASRARVNAMTLLALTSLAFLLSAATIILSVLYFRVFTTCAYGTTVCRVALTAPSDVTGRRLLALLFFATMPHRSTGLASAADVLADDAAVDFWSGMDHSDASCTVLGRSLWFFVAACAATVVAFILLVVQWAAARRLENRVQNRLDALDFVRHLGGVMGLETYEVSLASEVRRRAEDAQRRRAARAHRLSIARALAAQLGGGGAEGIPIDSSSMVGCAVGGGELLSMTSADERPPPESSRGGVSSKRVGGSGSSDSDRWSPARGGGAALPPHSADLDITSQHSSRSARRDDTTKKSIAAAQERSASPRSPGAASGGSFASFSATGNGSFSPRRSASPTQSTTAVLPPLILYDLVLRRAALELEVDEEMRRDAYLYRERVMRKTLEDEWATFVQRATTHTAAAPASSRTSTPGPSRQVAVTAQPTPQRDGAALDHPAATATAAGSRSNSNAWDYRFPPALGYDSLHPHHANNQNQLRGVPPVFQQQQPHHPHQQHRLHVATPPFGGSASTEGVPTVRSSGETASSSRQPHHVIVAVPPYRESRSRSPTLNQTFLVAPLRASGVGSDSFASGGGAGMFLGPASASEGEQHVMISASPPMSSSSIVARGAAVGAEHYYRHAYGSYPATASGIDGDAYGSDTAASPSFGAGGGDRRSRSSMREDVSSPPSYLSHTRQQRQLFDSSSPGSRPVVTMAVAHQTPMMDTFAGATMNDGALDSGLGGAGNSAGVGVVGAASSAGALMRNHLRQLQAAREGEGVFSPVDLHAPSAAGRHFWQGHDLGTAPPSRHRTPTPSPHHVEPHMAQSSSNPYGATPQQQYPQQRQPSPSQPVVEYAGFQQDDSRFGDRSESQNVPMTQEHNQQGRRTTQQRRNSGGASELYAQIMQQPNSPDEGNVFASSTGSYNDLAMPPVQAAPNLARSRSGSALRHHYQHQQQPQHQPQRFYDPNVDHNGLAGGRSHSGDQRAWGFGVSASKAGGGYYWGPEATLQRLTARGHGDGVVSSRSSTPHAAILGGSFGGGIGTPRDQQFSYQQHPQHRQQMAYANVVGDSSSHVRSPSGGRVFGSAREMPVIAQRDRAPWY